MEGIWLILIYGVGAGLVVVLGLHFYLRWVTSRRRSRCPHCGEPMTAEQVDAAQCAHCGARILS